MIDGGITVRHSWTGIGGFAIEQRMDMLQFVSLFICFPRGPMGRFALIGAECIDNKEKF